MMEHERNSVLSPSYKRGQRSRRTAGQGLSAYNGLRVAIVLSCQGQAQAFCGPAEYGTDDALGNVLRIRVDEPHDDQGGAELILSEREWDGEIRSGEQYGCDFCFLPSPCWPPG